MKIFSASDSQPDDERNLRSQSSGGLVQHFQPNQDANWRINAT